jgi:transglutaminase-like putative cysteine protease
MNMTRRAFIEHTLMASAGVAQPNASASTGVEVVDDPTSENLLSTRLIEANHPRIVTLAKQVTAGTNNKRVAAVLLHDWVRDQIPFGIPRGFYDTSAVETLDAKVGYCNTKVTLFSALLRATYIPTRMRIVDLSAQVLNGLLDPGTPYVDHAFAEVFLDGHWIKVDSYVVDKPLAVAARKRLATDGRKAAFGIHWDGQSEWDGLSDNFIQYMSNKSIPNYVLKDHGVFVDIADFYNKAANPRNRKTLLSGLGIQLGHSSINKKIEDIRRMR